MNDEVKENVQQNKPSMLPIFAYSAVLLICVATVVFMFFRPLKPIEKPEFPDGPGVAGATAKLSAARHQFFAESAQPVIKSTEKANREAMDRCIKRVDDLFDKYALGIDPFAEDIMSFGSRWQTVKNMSWDWWYELNSSSDYVGDKIEEHLFSEEKLSADLQEIMQTLRSDISANQTKMLSEIRASLDSSTLTSIELPQYDQFAKQMSVNLNRSFSDTAETSVKNGIVTLIVSEVSAVAAEQLIAQLLVRFGTAAATSGTVSGTAMAGGAAAGSGAGTFVTPGVGTAIGFGVGLVAGVIIDYFMSKSFASKLKTQMTEFLQGIKKGLIEGENEQAGLAADLAHVSDSLTENYRTTLFDSLVQSGGGK